MNSVETKLAAMGFELPPTPTPVAAYVPAVRTGNLIYVSGQVPREKGELKFVGYVGDSVTLWQAQQAARLCALNALAAVKSLTGSLDKVKRIVKLTGFVRSAKGFGDQPKVMDGASTFLGELFGDAGKHARAAVGVNELPMGVSVELDLIVEVE